MADDAAAIRILYMEDDPGLSRLLQKRLREKGYAVDTAANGEEGLAMVESSPFDLLLVDYNMPGCGGIEVLRTLTSRGAFPPVIMVTGNGNEDVAVESLKLGASDYIVKDVEMKYLELLPVVIEQVISKQRLIRERQQMLEQLRESEERYRRLVELSPDGIAIQIDGRIVFINPAGTMLFGASRAEDLIGKSLFDLFHSDRSQTVLEWLKRLEEHGKRVPWVEGKLVRFDGRGVDVEVAGIPFIYRERPAAQFIIRDITERKIAEQRLEYMALYDTLTGLPNRTLFFDRMDQLLALARRNTYILAVLYMDLDRFKFINDTMGHDAGDQLLKEVAKRLTTSTRKSDTVARMGGDEFISICAKITAPEDAGVIARKIIAALSGPFDLQGRECTISVSIGISLYPRDGDDGETLLKKADTAMYRVKGRGKGGFEFFSDVSAR
ncbi:MAG: diguanylate cyclase [Nitrospirota bacterium]